MTLGYGVMVTLQILVLSFQVRVLVSQLYLRCNLLVSSRLFFLCLAITFCAESNAHRAKSMLAVYCDEYETGSQTVRKRMVCLEISGYLYDFVVG